MFSVLRQHRVTVSLVLGFHVALLSLALAQTTQLKAETPESPTLVAMLLAPPAVAPAPKPQPEPQPQAKPEPQPRPKPQAKPAPRVQPTPMPPLPTAPPAETALQAPITAPAPTKPRPAKAVSAPAAPVIQPPSADAAGLQNKAPAYPLMSRKKKEQGVVLLLLLVKADGSVGEVRLQQSSGFARLDQAARQTVKKWRFTPAQQQGKAIDFWYEMPLKFSLDGL